MHVNMDGAGSATASSAFCGCRQADCGPSTRSARCSCCQRCRLQCCSSLTLARQPLLHSPGSCIPCPLCIHARKGCLSWYLKGPGTPDSGIDWEGPREARIDVWGWGRQGDGVQGQEGGWRGAQGVRTGGVVRCGVVWCGRLGLQDDARGWQGRAGSRQQAAQRDSGVRLIIQRRFV